MKSVTLVCLAGVILLGMANHTSLAQDQAEDTPTTPDKKIVTRVAVIDIEYILRNYMPLERELANLVDEAEELAEQVAKEQAAIDKKRETPQLYKVDTSQHQQITLDIAKARAVLHGSAEAKRAVFRRREARLYYRAYEEIRAAVATFTREHEIALVATHISWNSFELCGFGVDLENTGGNGARITFLERGAPCMQCKWVH